MNRNVERELVAEQRKPGSSWDSMGDRDLITGEKIIRSQKVRGRVEPILLLLTGFLTLGDKNALGGPGRARKSVPPLERKEGTFAPFRHKEGKTNEAVSNR